MSAHSLAACRSARARASSLALAALALLLPARAPAQPGLDAIVPPSPAPASFIHDGGPVLDAAAHARLDERIAQVQRTTGGDVAVAILRDIGDRAASDVGVAIYRAWGVGRVDSLGSARRDLGALLLIVPRELAPGGRGDCWITTGLGAEGELRDADAGTICRRAIIPHLREQRYEEAIAAGVDAIGESFARATAGLDAPASVGRATRDDDGGPGAGAWILGGGALVGGAAGGAALLARRRRRRPRPCPRGHGPMVLLPEAEDDVALDAGQRTEERVRSVDYDVWACRTCDARLVLPYRRWLSSYQGCPKCRYRTVERRSRTLTAATTTSTGLEEVTLTCANCGWQKVTRRVTPKVEASGGSGGLSLGGGGGSGGGGRSFGGSGRTSGGGGGSRY